eukprot:CAMPEP_0176383498 /NCGR_PEP_ID=MMETSP0126-20121128/33556_1 /TAXON_ID=141414 ORGANISM="Strombidinopsis acuminatum, Strain SPMC142" /NCGR_SAMPLE_ID=MMETSP0126 /ASSEMBLY_ACC=CAM_ASM_000229 /LENGTH=102 /DNA_ID=CAMNT_0017748611 /DNA_START=312 /DNA_END=620 /DNA_ORIENTATION=-
MHNEALSRLDKELDILHYIEGARKARFIGQMYMSKSQGHMVRYFRRYALTAKHLFQQHIDYDPTSDELLEDFSPESNLTDKRILFEITGRKLDDSNKDSSFK